MRPSIWTTTKTLVQSVGHTIIWRNGGNDRMKVKLDKDNNYEPIHLKKIVRLEQHKPKALAINQIGMDINLSKLEMLPQELHDMIINALDNVSKACLAKTNSRLQGSIKVDRSTLSLCEKWLLSCRLETDMKNYHQSFYHCCFCKTRRPRQQFVASNAHQIHRGRRIDNARVVTAKPMERYCWIHRVRTQWEDNTCYRETDRRRWVQIMQLTCLHCREAVSEADGRATGCEGCQCETCPRAKLPIYLRYGPPNVPGGHFRIPELLSLHRVDSKALWARELDCIVFRLFNRDPIHTNPGF